MTDGVIWVPIACNCAGTPPTMPSCRSVHLPTCPLGTLGAVLPQEIVSYCDSSAVTTERVCGACGVKATPETIARWFIDEDPKWDRCDEHHPYNGNAEASNG